MEPILTKEHESKVNEALKIIPGIEAELAKARAAGFDIGTMDQEVKRRKERLLAIKQVYFPNR